MNFFAEKNSGAELRYGVMITPGLGMGYPETKELVGKIFRDRIARLPWVPRDWLAGVEALQQQNPDDLVRIAPSRRPKTEGGRFISDAGPASPNAPLFLDDDQKLDAWMSIYRDVQKAVMAYAAAQAAVGRRELDALYAKAAFWDASYKIAVFVRDAPGAALGAVGSGIADFIGATVKGLTGKSILGWGLLFLAVFAGLWFWLSPSSFLRVTKLGSLAKLAKGARG